MNGKIARISELMAAGWDIEDIQSSESAIAVLMQRGARRQTVVLDRRDAWDVLFGDAFQPAAQRPRDALAVSR